MLRFVSTIVLPVGDSIALNLDGSAQTILPGGSVTFTWSSSGAKACSLTGPGVSASGTSGSTVASNIINSSIYKLECSNDAFSASATFFVAVIYPDPSSTLSGTWHLIRAVPSLVSASGGNTTVYWGVRDADSCAVVGPGLSAVGLSGTQTVLIRERSTFTITCDSPNGQFVDTAVVNIAPVWQEL